MKDNNIGKETPLNYARSKLKSLKHIRNSLQKKYIILTTLLFVMNISTVIMSILGISLLATETLDGPNIELVFASLSSFCILLLFIIHTINFVYRGFMQDRSYKLAMERIQLEVIKFNESIDEYSIETNGKKEDYKFLTFAEVKRIRKENGKAEFIGKEITNPNEKLLLKNIKHIYKKAIKKSKKKSIKKTIKVILKGNTND